MLEGGVQKSRVVVWRRGAALVRRPIRRQDGRLVATETADVIAEERHLVVPALSERKKPINIQKETCYHTMLFFKCCDILYYDIF